MKKYLTLFLLIAGMVSTASAQRAQSGVIRVAFCDPSNTWQQSHFYMYVFNSSNNDPWPGVDITANTTTINGQTYYYRDFPIETYGTGFSVIAVNNDGNGGSQSQSVDLNWCYDRSSITGDTYYSLKNSWTDSKREADLVEMWYIADYDNTGKVLLTERNGSTFTTEFSSDTFPRFVVANSYAFKDDGTLDYSQNNGFPANIYRPNSQVDVEFTNVSRDVSNDDRADFYKWHKNGYFDASALSDIDIKMEFTIDFNYEWRPTNFKFFPSFTRTLPAAAEGYATFSSDYDVLVPSGLTAKYATVDGTTITWTDFDATGIKAGEGALLSGVAGQEYKFTPATSAVALSTNALKPIDATLAASALAQTDNGNTRYILAKKNDLVAFYKVNSAGSWCSAGTAYLEVSSASLSREFFAVENEDITAIETIQGETSLKGNVYSITGQRIANPTRGLYIVNGKKVLVK